jgi:hypothetical protein
LEECEREMPSGQIKSAGAERSYLYIESPRAIRISRRVCLWGLQ